MEVFYTQILLCQLSIHRVTTLLRINLDMKGVLIFSNNYYYNSCLLMHSWLIINDTLTMHSSTIIICMTKVIKLG